MSVLQSQQILVPKKVYIGDTAELLCTFSSNQEFFSPLSQKETQTLELPLTSFNGNLNSIDYEIQKVEISQVGINYYQFKITFIPWKTGKIQFPSYNLASALNSTGTEKVFIKFEPQNIVSLIEQNNTYSLRAATNPLLLPGTAYKLYGTLLLAILLLIVVIRSIIKHKEIAFFIKTRKLIHKYNRNKRQTFRKLKKLPKQNLEDKEFATEIQKILRNYLEVRFEYPFTKTVSSQIMNGINQATSGLLSETKLEAAGVIASAFIRTDFIRYAQGSFGSEKAEFKENEASELLENLRKNINILESTEKEVKKSEEKEEK